MLKLFGIGILLSVSLIVSGAQNPFDDADTGNMNAAPTPLDMVLLLSSYLHGEVSAQSFFNMGVQANMNIPMEHLRVQVTDVRTGMEMSRDDIAQILGQSRQAWSHDLITHTLSTFAVTELNSDQLISLFDAAALASMRISPEFINVEFYDARIGPTDAINGGISGSLPRKNDLPETASGVTETFRNEWHADAIIDFFVANEQTFGLKNEYEFLLPYRVEAKNIDELNSIAREELKIYTESESDAELFFFDNDKPFFNQAAVGIEGELRKYIGLLHLKTSSKEKAIEMREMFIAIYD